jgi:hypothetical protein
MREISVALNASVEETFDMFLPSLRILVEDVRRQKLAGERRLPSTVLTDRSSLLTSSARGKLLDTVASWWTKTARDGGYVPSVRHIALQGFRLPAISIAPRREQQSIMT